MFWKQREKTKTKQINAAACSAGRGRLGVLSSNPSFGHQSPLPSLCSLCWQFLTGSCRGEPPFSTWHKRGQLSNLMQLSSCSPRHLNFAGHGAGNTQEVLRQQVLHKLCCPASVGNHSCHKWCAVSEDSGEQQVHLCRHWSVQRTGHVLKTWLSGMLESREGKRPEAAFSSLRPHLSLTPACVLKLCCNQKSL